MAATRKKEEDDAAMGQCFLENRFHISTVFYFDFKAAKVRKITGNFSILIQFHHLVAPTAHTPSANRPLGSPLEEKIVVCCVTIPEPFDGIYGKCWR